MEQGRGQHSFDIRVHPVSGTTLVLGEAAVRGFESGLARLGLRVDSPESFNRFCKEAIGLWQRVTPGTSSIPQGQFVRLMGVIEENAPRNPMTPIIPTPWGGVVVEQHTPPNVEKWLVIKRGGYLALEWHQQKEERIEACEGVALLLEPSGDGRGTLRARLFLPGDSATFNPGDVHCLIGLENSAVFEVSKDHKGMDKDLEFIFVPAT